MKRSLFALGCLVLAGVAQAQPRLVGRFGEAMIGNERVIVHVTVAVPQGQSDNDATENALRGQGARPLQSADFKTEGLVWDQFTSSGSGVAVLQNYNSAGEPLSTLDSLLNAESTWTSVSTSKFSMTSGSTTRCPSLVNECPGKQVFDGNNDVGWVAINGCCTLAVTWYGTSRDAADMGINNRFQWTTNGVSGYDLETVLLHENGHVVGLDHSTVAGSVMQAVYGGIQHTLGEDDVRGATYLYPEAGSTGSISGSVKSDGNVGIQGATVTIPNFPQTATTDASGAYSLNGVPNIGLYSVTASASGYIGATQTSVAVFSTVNFTLQPKNACVPRGNGNNCK